MNPETIDEYEIAGGHLACHRKHLLVLPGPLGKLAIIHQPCIREKCTLWDAANNQCTDVSNADSIAMIASGLDNLIKQVDVLCYHAGEK